MSFDASTPTHETQQIGPGALALIVGASGAGKDALIFGARVELSDNLQFVFPERTITRAPHSAESHQWLSDAAFANAEQQGQFAITWEAHGLRYGLPESMNSAIRQGHIVIVNGSRAIISAVRGRYARTAVILVECPSDIRAARLALRGREPPVSVEARLTRNVPAFDPADVDVRIDNSGSIEDGVQALVATLQSLASDTG